MFYLICVYEFTEFAGYPYRENYQSFKIISFSFFQCFIMRLKLAAVSSWIQASQSHQRAKLQVKIVLIWYYTFCYIALYFARVYSLHFFILTHLLLLWHVYTPWKQKTVRLEFEEFVFIGNRAWWLSVIFLRWHFYTFLPVLIMDKSTGFC